MALVTTLLRSRAAAALASPHGVDHYLEQLNPMWAAHDVRARVVAVHRETETAGACVATITLQPTDTWRGHRAGQYVQVGVELPGHGPPPHALLLHLVRRLAAGGADHPDDPRPRRGPGQQVPGPRRAARPDGAPEPGRGRLHAARERGHPDQQPPGLHHRRLGHHAGDVDRAHAAAGRLRRSRQPQGHVPALRAQRGRPDLRRGAGRDRGGRQPRRRPSAVRRPARSASSSCVASCRTSATPTPGSAGRAGWSTWCTAAYDGSDRLRVEFFKPPRTSTGVGRGRRQPSPAPAQTAANTAPRCSSRPRHWA